MDPRKMSVCELGGDFFLTFFDSLAIFLITKEMNEYIFMIIKCSPVTIYTNIHVPCMYICINRRKQRSSD